LIKRVSLGELVAEYIGSMFLVMAAISSMILFTSVFESAKGIAVLANAFAVAFVLCALIEMFGGVSGAHFNPVVTLVMAFEKKDGALKAVVFMLFQIAGGITGTIISRLMFLDEVGSILAVSDTVRSDYVYIGEVVGTFVLVLAILMLGKMKSSKISIIVGFLVGGQLLSTSSTMFANPQVTIARMFTNTAAGIRPTDGLIFIIMQIIGALLAYAVYKLVFSKNDYRVEEDNVLRERMCLSKNKLS